jgi:Spy/CpxP family protein refolding chaperone
MLTKKIVPLLLLLGGAPAFAQTVAPSQAEARQQIVDRELDQLTAKLGLDAAGAARFRQTFARYQSQLAPLRQEQFQTRRALKDELAKPQPDASRLQQLTDTLSSNRQRMESIEAQRRAELKQELTPQQYAQLVVSRREVMRDLHRQMRALHGVGSPSAE